MKEPWEVREEKEHDLHTLSQVLTSFVRVAVTAPDLWFLLMFTDSGLFKEPEISLVFRDL